MQIFEIELNILIHFVIFKSFVIFVPRKWCVFFYFIFIKLDNN